MDIGSSRTEKLLLRRRRDMAFRGSQASDPAPVRTGWAGDGCGTTCVTPVLEHPDRHFHLMVLTGHERARNWRLQAALREFIARPAALSDERVHANCAAPWL